MSSRTGTIDRSRGLSLTSNQIRRQRSVEWQKERNYSSSEEENDRIVGRTFGDVNRKNPAHSSIILSTDTSVLAQLIAQSQGIHHGKLANIDIANYSALLSIKLINRKLPDNRF